MTGVEDLTGALKEDTASPGTLHTNPNWFSDMRLAFQVSLGIFTLIKMNLIFLQEFVVERCTKRTKDAVAKNEDIENLADRRKVMNEIINQTTDYMAPIFGSDGPSIPDKILLLKLLPFLLLQKRSMLHQLLSYLARSIQQCSIMMEQKKMSPHLLAMGWVG